MIDGTAKPALLRGVRLHHDRVRETWVLLAPERALRLDPVGHAILSRVDGETPFDGIVADLAGVFDAPREQIARDAGAFLTSLIERRMAEARQ